MQTGYLMRSLVYRPNQLYIMAKGHNDSPNSIGLQQLDSLTDEQSLEILNQHDDSKLHLQQNILHSSNIMTELAVVTNTVGIEQIL